MNYEILQVFKSNFHKRRYLSFFLFLVCVFLCYSFNLNAQNVVNFFHQPTYLSTKAPLPFEISFHPDHRNLIFQPKLKNTIFSNFSLKVNFSESLLDSQSTTLPSNREISFLQPTSPFAWRASSFTIEKTKQNFIYFGSIITQLSLNEGNHTLPELYSFQLGIQYKLLNTKWFGLVSAGVKLGLQQVYDLTLGEKNKRLDFKKTSFLTPSLFINGKGFMVEGLVRLPIQEIYDHEVLLRPEYFGRLGLYWNLPDKIQP